MENGTFLSDGKVFGRMIGIQESDVSRETFDSCIYIYYIEAKHRIGDGRRIEYIKCSPRKRKAFLSVFGVNILYTLFFWCYVCENMIYGIEFDFYISNKIVFSLSSQGKDDKCCNAYVGYTKCVLKVKFA